MEQIQYSLVDAISRDGIKQISVQCPAGSINLFSLDKQQSAVIITPQKTVLWLLLFQLLSEILTKE